MSENINEIEEKIDQEIKNRLDLEVKKEVEELLQKDLVLQKLSSKIKEDIPDNINSQKINDNFLKSKENFQNNFSNKEENNQNFESQDEEEMADQLEKDKRKSSSDRQKKETETQDKNRKGPKMDSRTTPMRENPTKKPERDENTKKESPESSLDNFKKNNQSESGDSKNEAQLNAAKNQDKSAKVSASSGASAGSESVSGIEKFTKAVDELLKSAWENLIDSCGLTLLYIYFHWFMHQLFPKFFCDLGQEWVPKEVKSVAPDKAKIAGKKIGIAEKGLVGCTCLLLLWAFVVSIIMTLLALLIAFPQIFVGMALWDVIKDWVASIVTS